jgi:hypothetical protein
MSRPTRRLLALVALLLLASAQAAAQPAGAPFSRPWIVVGGGSTTLLGDCRDCGEPENYRHAGSVLVHAGFALNARTDFGAEVLWVPSTLVSGERLRTTFLMAAVQFRPWRTRGFFLKAGSGITFVRNWVVNFENEEDTSPPFTSPGFGLDVGAGWVWRTRGRLGAQIFGAQHVVALGDLETSTRVFENVVGNFWSIGAALVIR